MLARVAAALARAFAVCLVVLAWLLVTQGVEGRPARLFFTRLALETLAAHLALLALVHRDRVRARLASFLREERGPLNLAVFRIAFFLVVYWRVPFDEVARTAVLSRALVVPPVGTGWLMPYLPIDAGLGALACGVLSAAALTGALGFYTRTSAALVALSGLYAFGLPNFFGKVHHTHHHLVLFAALLAASRAGDALSVDAWLARRRGAAAPRASVAYALPVKMLWLLMAVIYFFPGFWKLWASGVDWIASDNMVRTMQYKWYEVGGSPAWLRPDHYPRLMRAGALAALSFELAFPIAVFVTPLRHAVALTGFLFHGFSEWLLMLSFRPLMLCYVVFVDWERLARGASVRAVTTARDLSAARPAAWVGAGLVAAMVWAGASHHYTGWPFAMYPTMEHINESPYVLSLRLAAHDERGPMPAMERAVDELRQRLDPVRWRERVYRFFNTKVLERRLLEVRAIWDECVHLHPELKAARRLKVYQVVDSLIPEEVPKNPVRERLLYDIAL